MENEKLKNGLQEYFHENGQFMCCRIWKDGYVVDGDVLVYDFDGKLHEKEIWKNGRCQVFLDGDDFPYCEYGLFNGLGDGECKLFFGDGSVRKISFYKNGQLAGKESRFYPNGRLFECHVYDENGVADGKYTVYNEDGSIKQYNVWKNNILSAYRVNNTLFFTVPGAWGKMEGILKGYDEAGNLEAEIAYKDDKYNGISKHFYPDGSLRTLANYVDGKLDGLTSIYDEKGNLSQETFYANGDRNGMEKLYSDGKIITANMYVEGEYCGSTLYEYYEKTGTLYSESSFNGNLPNGLTKTYYENGVLMSEIPFKDGMAVDGKVTIYDENGAASYVIEHKNNVRRTYFDNGAIEAEVVLYRRAGNGRMVIYCEEGSLIEESYFFEGDLCESKEEFLDKTFEKLANDCKEYFDKVEKETFRNFFSNRYKEIMEGPLADIVYDNYKELTGFNPEDELEWDSFIKQVAREFILRLRLPNDGATEQGVIEGLTQLLH